MLTDNNQVVSKNNVLTKLKIHKANKFEVWDVYTQKDKDELMKHINPLIKKNSISIIILQENKL